METPVHPMSALFAQLGLPSDEAAIDGFIRSHTPLPASVALEDAPFWSAAQRAFLCSEIRIDADWAGVIDQLNLLLSGKGSPHR